MQRPRCIYASRACVRARAPASLRGVLCAFTAVRARADTRTGPKLAQRRYIYCNKLRCTYVQRALHVTHVLAYATGSLCSLSFLLSVDLSSSLFSSSYSIYLPLLPRLSRSSVPHRIYVHTHRVSFCSLCSSLCRSTSLSFSFVRVPVARSRYIYTRRSAHTRPRRVHAGVGHVRAALFARSSLRLLYVERALSELYALFSDLLRRAFRCARSNKDDSTKTSGVLFRKVRVFCRVFSR